MKKIFLILFILLSIFAKSANIKSTVGGGAWKTAGTWVGGVVPNASDNVTIVSTATVTITTSPTCNNIIVNGVINFNTANQTLTINGDATIYGSIIGSGAARKLIINGDLEIPVGVSTSIPGFTVSVFGTLQIDGTLSFTNTTGTKTFNNILITSTGTWLNSSESFTITDSLTNNGTFTSGYGIYLFTGTNSAICGTNPITILDVTINKTASSNFLELNTNLSVPDTIKMTQGCLDLNGYNLLLGTTGKILNETTNNRIFGSSGDGYIESIRTLAASTLYSNLSLGNIGISITTTAIAPGLTTIHRGYKQQSNIGSGLSIYRYFDITPTTDAGLNATLIFYYWLSEVPVGFVEANFNMWESSFPFTTWASNQGSENAVANTYTKTGINSFSRWTLADNTNPMPIELYDFYTIKDGNNIIIDWKTLSETNNDYFILHKSYDENNWIELNKQSGSGTSNSLLNYSYIDSIIRVGIIYYKLEQVDYNGDSKFYGPIFINILEGDAEIVKIYPNPATTKLTVEMFDLTSNDAEISIYDINGSLMSEVKITNIYINKVQYVSVESLSRGVYNLVFKSDAYNKSFKFIKK